MLSYLCESRHWIEKIFVIAHNAKAFDLHIILKRAILLKWQFELIMNGIKIMYVRVDHLVFLDSISFLQVVLRKLPEAFGITVSKSWYSCYFNTQANLYYVGKITDVSYYSIDEMSAGRSLRQQMSLGSVLSG